MLALTTVGRRSGRERTTMLAYVRRDGAYFVGATNLGGDADPAWCLNLRTQPQATIEVEGRRIAVTADELTGEEARPVGDAFVAQLPAIRHTLAVTPRAVPIVRLRPG